MSLQRPAPDGGGVKKGAVLGYGKAKLRKILLLSFKGASEGAPREWQVTTR